MRKIYLAILDSSESNKIKSQLGKETEVIELSDQREVEKILYSDYDLCIIDASKFPVDKKSIDLSKLKGEILFLDSSEPMMGPGPIQSFDSITRIIAWFKVKKFSTNNQRDLSNNEQETRNNTLLITENNTNSNKEKRESEEKVTSIEQIENESIHTSTNSIEKEIKEKSSMGEKETKDSEIVEKETEPTRNKETKVQNHQNEQGQENLWVQRATFIRKKVFSQASWENNRTIGIWSPLHRMGVSTFVINFALFLSKLHVPTAVVESLTEYQILKTTLKRYGSMPENWVSVVQALQDSTIPVENVKWTYRGVHWLPLDDGDVSLTWDKDILQSYLCNVKYFDIVLVDLPTGDMKPYTLDTLEYIDELWIMVDDSYQQILAWKKYINNIQTDYDLTIKLIFNRHTSISKERNIETGLEIPLLTTLPDLTKFIYLNYYDNKPLIDSNHVFSFLKEPFRCLAIELLGNNYVSTHMKEGYVHRLRELFDSIVLKVLHKK